MAPPASRITLHSSTPVSGIVATVRPCQATSTRPGMGASTDTFPSSQVGAGREVPPFHALIWSRRHRGAPTCSVTVAVSGAGAHTGRRTSAGRAGPLNGSTQWLHQPSGV